MRSHPIIGSVFAALSLASATSATASSPIHHPASRTGARIPSPPGPGRITFRCGNASAADRQGADTLLSRLYSTGQTYAELVAASTRFQKEWTDRYAAAVTPPDLLARARAIKGEWRILAVAADWCSDSYSNLPHIARLLDSVPNVQLRIVDTTAGSAVMRAHRTADGRSATPTLILLDAAGNDVGCFVERPAALRAFLTREPPLTSADVRTEKRAWYAKNNGVETIRDLIEMLEGAVAGTPKCSAAK